MERHHHPQEAGGLDRDGWRAAWRKARHARSKGRLLAGAPGAELAARVLEARAFGDRRAWITAEHDRLVREHGYRHSWRGLLEGIA